MGGGRRGVGEGSIYRRKDGRWVAAAIVGGARRTVYAKTRVDAAQRLTQLLRLRDDGFPYPDSRRTLSVFLLDWLEAIQPTLRPTTWKRYDEFVRLHINPALGSVPLGRLSALQLQHFYADRLRSGLAPMTVRHFHAMLHRALRQALQWDMVARNVAGLATPPRAGHKEMRHLEPEQVRRLLAAARDHRLGALLAVAVTTGLRQGELLALRWRCVDLERECLSVVGTLQRGPGGLDIAAPKTRRSQRQVALTDAAVAALRRHRIRQAEDRLLVGPEWSDMDLVFANHFGRYLDAGDVRKWFAEVLGEAGLPRVRFHDLRHSAATLLLGRGTHPKIVSEMLGHTTIAITLDLYSHVTPTMHREAARTMDEILRG